MLSTAELGKLRTRVSKLNNKFIRLFDALADINRFKIFTLLLESKENNICVSEFADILGISVPAASQQLKNLETSGLIKRVRDGQMICYQVSYEDPTVKSIVKTVKESL